MRQRARQAFVLAWLAVLSACGGGGGGGGDGAPEVPLSIRFDPDRVDVQGVEGTPVVVQVTAAIEYTPGTQVFLALEDPSGLIADADGEPGFNEVRLTLSLRALPLGRSAGELLLHACLDEACTREAGAPGRLPLNIEMLPNIAGPASVALQRSGREPAPEAVIPVVVPAAAGSVEMSVDTWVPARFEASFDGTTVRVRTRQEPAGEYSATLTLHSPSDPRYRHQIALSYTVAAPPQGEQPMQVSASTLTASMPQGEVRTRRFTLTRPTWTDALDAPQLFDSDGLFSLRALGADEYEVTFDGRNRPVGDYFGQIGFTAGPTGGSSFVSLQAGIGLPLLLPDSLSRSLDAASTAADLRLSTPVLAPDGAAVRWTASSRADWMRVLTPSGITGTDVLQLEIDAASLPRLALGHAAEIDIALERAGTLPVTVPASLYNRIPRLDIASMRVLGGSRARVYAQGSIPEFFGDVAAAAGLRVEGARLVRVLTPSDSRFVGSMPVLQVDIDSVTAGSDVTLRIDSALMPTELRLRAEPPARVPTGYQTLPHGSYRPANFAAGRRAVYVAGPDRVIRWAHDGALWSATEQPLPGLIDVTPQPDEARLIAIARNDQVIALDADTLLEMQRTGLYASPPPVYPFDDTVPAGLRALAYSADLRAFAGKRGQGLLETSHGVACFSGAVPDVDLLDRPGWSDPGHSLGSTTSAGLVRSPGGHALAFEYQPGAWRLYEAAARSPRELTGAVPAERLAALSDDARWLLFANGLLRTPSQLLVDLHAALPSTHVAAGHALSAEAGYALIYGYRVTDEAGQPRARDATLWVLDLGNLHSMASAITPIVAALPLADAVGCTAVPASPGESCAHRGLITVGADGGSAFVVGPRGIAAVALPAAVSTSAAGRTAAARLRFLAPAGRR